MMYRLEHECCGNAWTTIRSDSEKAPCPTCGKAWWPARMYKVEKTEAGWQIVMPSYTPPSTQERVQLLASLPYSQRKSRAEKARPMDAGLFDVEGRRQLDWLDIKET